MAQINNLEDTIVAISTATGQGGIGIVRLSGKHSLKIADQLFVGQNNIKPSAFKSYTIRYGEVRDVKSDETIDEALVTVMRAPKSYTTEDIVEINCHGGGVSLKAIVKLAVSLGARLAEPGEFTKRAFLNGRIHLTQAEAVLDIIQSKTDAFLQVSTNQLKGDLSTELEAIREVLMGVYIEIEALVNFPEDEVKDTSEKQNFDSLKDQITAAQQRVNILLQSGDQGRILKEGIKIVLCGKSNVGKSSLLNVLLKAPRAIVSDIAGTTRDTIEETAQIQGIPFQLIDTAGILEPRDLIEEEAIKRSHDTIAGADLILFVIDASEDLTNEDENLIRVVGNQSVIVILNKCDLKQKIKEKDIQSQFDKAQVLNVSALKRLGMGQLETAIVEHVWHDQNVDTHGLLVSNIRHIQALKDCWDTLEKANQGLDGQLSLEFVSEEIKIAVNYLDNITGKNIDADLLENIFSMFCIGK